MRPPTPGATACSAAAEAVRASGYVGRSKSRGLNDFCASSAIKCFLHFGGTSGLGGLGQLCGLQFSGNDFRCTRLKQRPGLRGLGGVSFDRRATGLQFCFRKLLRALSSFGSRSLRGDLQGRSGFLKSGSVRELLIRVMAARSRSAGLIIESGAMGGGDFCRPRISSSAAP